MSNAGDEIQIFAVKSDFFENAGIYKMLVLDGLSLSLQLIKKMQLQEKEPNHGNDLIDYATGHRYQQLYKSLWHFLRVQNPLLTVSPKEQCPNVKVN